MNTNEAKLQDYLDDRMNAEERSAFEQRLARDPQLSDRLAESLGLRDALRKEEPLPPGFITRTRAEFERRQHPRKRGFSLLSWEALGLAAAAGLALALFVPGLLQEGLPQAPSADEASRSQPLGLPEAQKTAATADDDAVASADPAGEPVSEKVEGLLGLGESEERRAQVPPPKPKVGRTERKKEIQSTAAPGGDGSDQASGKPAPPAPADEPQRTSSFAPSPPTSGSSGSSGSSASTPPSTASEGRREDAAKSSRRSRVVSGRQERDLATVIRATPLRIGTVPRFAVRSLGSAEAEALLTAPEETETDLLKNADAEVAPEPLAATQRVVLIGARDRPFSCDGVSVETSATEHVVYLSRATPDRPAAAGGCALYLPADDRAIVVVDP